MEWGDLDTRSVNVREALHNQENGERITGCVGHTRCHGPSPYLETRGTVFVPENRPQFCF